MFNENTQPPRNEENPIILKGDERKSFIIDMADEIASYNLLCTYNNARYQYNNPIYVPFNEFNFCQWIFNESKKKGVTLSNNHCIDVMQETFLRSPIYQGESNSEDYTVFKNHTVCNKTGQISANSSKNFATICVEGNYLPNTPLYHPATDAFLNMICDGDPDLIRRHWEFWGYTLSSDAHAKVIFFLYGATGNNGKSTELNLLKALLSKGSVINMPLKTLLGEFGKAYLCNHRLEISADEGELNLKSKDIGYLKSFSGHDDITTNIKFKDFSTFTCTCKIAIASNNNIGSAYTAVDPAFARRLLTIPYPVCISKEQQNPYILQNLLAERDAIVTEAFQHYLNLRARTYTFSGCGIYSSDFPATLFMPLNNEYHVVQLFSKMYCDFSDESNFTSTQDLYHLFNVHYPNVFKEITSFSQAFYRANTDNLSKSRKHTSQQNIRGFYGVKPIST